MPTGTQSPASAELEKANVDTSSPVKLFTPRIFAMIMIVSLGGLIFGYDTGQISGFLEMDDFLMRFGDTTDPDTGAPAFSKVRSGTIVGLLSIGTLIGAIVGAPIADAFGRKLAIVFWNIIFCVGVVIQMTTLTTWYQVALGRWVAGLGVGALSVLTPMYQSETAPRQIRGSMVSCYQLFITLGIFIAYCINYGTKSQTNSPSSWRIPMGVGFIWSVIMAIGIMFLRESPRWEYRKGKIESARTTIAKSYGVPENHWEVDREIREIKAKLDAENAGGGKHPWYEVFTGPRMMYRTLLGISMQALQQLTGANFFFYYGTTIFTATGLDDSFQTSMILGGINFFMTIPGTYVVEKFGRRRALITGGLWMFCCFMVFASVGHFALDQDNPKNTPEAGSAMIAFACLFIAGYAMTWAPIVWAIVGELYPTRYRAQAMGLATASNWIWVRTKSPSSSSRYKNIETNNPHRTSSSPSSPPSSPAPSTTATATSSRPATSSAPSSSTSSSAKPAAAPSRKSTQCISCTSRPARAQSGFLRRAKTSSPRTLCIWLLARGASVRRMRRAWRASRGLTTCRRPLHSMVFMMCPGRGTRLRRVVLGGSRFIRC
jgi:SP family sugar:H+ symporter-like MFS transporter